MRYALVLLLAVLPLLLPAQYTPATNDSLRAEFIRQDSLRCTYQVLLLANRSAASEGEGQPYSPPGSQQRIIRLMEAQLNLPLAAQAAGYATAVPRFVLEMQFELDNDSVLHSFTVQAAQACLLHWARRGALVRPHQQQAYLEALIAAEYPDAELLATTLLALRPDLAGEDFSRYKAQVAALATQQVDGFAEQARYFEQTDWALKREEVADFAYWSFYALVYGMAYSHRSAQAALELLQ